MLYTDIDFMYYCYEIDHDDKLVFITDNKPQIVTVHENTFIVPLYCSKPISDYNTKVRDVCYDMLYHVAEEVPAAVDVEHAKKEFKNLGIPFGEVIKISKPGQKTLEFALADKEFRGMFVARTKPVHQIGAFMWMKSIIKIINPW